MCWYQKLKKKLILMYFYNKCLRCFFLLVLPPIRVTPRIFFFIWFRSLNYCSEFLYLYCIFDKPKFNGPKKPWGPSFIELNQGTNPSSLGLSQGMDPSSLGHDQGNGVFPLGHALGTNPASLELIQGTCPTSIGLTKRQIDHLLDPAKGRTHLIWV
jgi:hypothetical protein